MPLLVERRIFFSFPRFVSIIKYIHLSDLTLFALSPLTTIFPHTFLFILSGISQKKRKNPVENLRQRRGLLK